MIQFSARNFHNPLVRLLVQPNLALQHLTTRQPEMHMLEVAIVAFERVLVSEGLQLRRCFAGLGVCITRHAGEAQIPAPNPEAVSPTLAAADQV